HGEMAEVLAGDFLLADDFCFRASQFFGRETGSAQEFSFLEHLLFDEGDFGGFGADVEGKVAGAQAKKVLRADVVREAEIVADAHEHARSEVASRFLAELE